MSGKKVSREDNDKSIRIVLSGTEKDKIESVTTDMLRKLDRARVTYRGPRRFPTRTLRHTIRKSVSGQGKETWHRFQMKIYKRCIDIEANAERLSKMGVFVVKPGIAIDVIMFK